MARARGKWTVLSLDPSINDCGFCGWNGGLPVEWGVLHPPRALKDWRLKAASVRDKVLSLIREHDPLFVVSESPNTIYQGKKWDGRSADGTLRLVYLVGMMASAIHVPPSVPRFFLEVTPDKWKGRSQKTANLSFVNHIYGQYGVNLKNKKRELDIADAIGIGHWFHHRASVNMLGRGLHAPCSKSKTVLLKRALNKKGWRK